MTMEQMTLLVDGMRCRRCVRDVTRRLRDVPGVQTVAANTAASRVRLTGTMSLADVLKAFSGTTYGPQVVSRAPMSFDG